MHSTQVNYGFVPGWKLAQPILESYGVFFFLELSPMEIAKECSKIHITATKGSHKANV